MYYKFALYRVVKVETFAKERYNPAAGYVEKPTAVMFTGKVAWAQERPTPKQPEKFSWVPITGVGYFEPYDASPILKSG